MTASLICCLTPPVRSASPTCACPRGSLRQICPPDGPKSGVRRQLPIHQSVSPYGVPAPFLSFLSPWQREQASMPTGAYSVTSPRLFFRTTAQTVAASIQFSRSV